MTCARCQAEINDENYYENDAVTVCHRCYLLWNNIFSLWHRSERDRTVECSRCHRSVRQAATVVGECRSCQERSLQAAGAWNAYMGRE